MSKRNPLNPRYKKEAQVGSTRKSAASAKISKPGSGSSSSSSSSKEQRRAKLAGTARSRTAASYARPQLPPDLKRLQKVSFALLGVAVLFSASFLIAQWQGVTVGKTAQIIVLGIAYAVMFAGMYIDLVKIRPWIKANRNAGKK